MIFSGTTPDEIYVWIDKKNNGDDSDYTNGKHDTKEAINVFQSLYGYTFKNEYRLFRYFFKHLCMREADSQSLYRAFIVLNNDEIITIRLSRHFATKNSANRAFNNYGKPKIEYHLVISRYQQPVNANKDVYYDMEISGVEIKVREYELSEFNDGNIRSGILDEIIKLLTYGVCPPANNENKQYNDMNRKIVRLTESDLRSIVKEAVNRIINEEGGFGGGATNASYGRDLMRQKNPTLYNDGSQSKRVGNMMKITRNGDTSYLANDQTPQSFKPVEESDDYDPSDDWEFWEYHMQKTPEIADKKFGKDFFERLALKNKPVEESVNEADPGIDKYDFIRQYNRNKQNGTRWIDLVTNVLERFGLHLLHNYGGSIEASIDKDVDIRNIIRKLLDELSVCGNDGIYREYTYKLYNNNTIEIIETNRYLMK